MKSEGKAVVSFKHEGKKIILSFDLIYFDSGLMIKRKDNIPFNIGCLNEFNFNGKGTNPKIKKVRK